MPARRAASYRYERRAWRAGTRHLAGVDEVGRGPLAGPVVAAAVVLDPRDEIRGLADSKRLTPAERERLDVAIRARALAIGLGLVDHATIDRVNILEATRQAMLEAIGALGVAPDLVVTDAVRLGGLACAQLNLIRGDARCASVAAASIVAKVARDRLMQEADARFPQYGFARHKGYPTAAHLAALDRHGPCPIHRRTFAGVWRQGLLFER